jgi:hypothetical protein
VTLPSTNYATATLVNPTAALTDFTLLVDLSRMPLEWWAAVDTTDGTRGRAAKGDGTELAVDWIDFDSVNETGWARVKWSGTLATTGSQVLRVYPPKAANAAVAAGDTYGRHAAYDGSWVGYWPLSSDASDRTSNGYDLTPQNGLSVGGASGKGPGATAFDEAASEYLSRAHLTELDAGFVTAMVWADFQPVSHIWNQALGQWDFRIQRRGASGVVRMIQPGESANATYAGGLKHYAGSFNNATDLKMYLNAADQGAPSVVPGAWTPGTQDVWVGRAHNTVGNYFTGVIGEAQYHSVVRPPAWVAQEFEQSDDQATFWGTWTDNPAPSIGRRRAMVIG